MNYCIQHGLNFKISMPIERTQTPRKKKLSFNLNKSLENVTYSIAMESRSVLAWGWGRCRKGERERL